MTWYNKILEKVFRSYAREIDTKYKTLYDTALQNASISDAVRGRLKGITASKTIKEDKESVMTKYMETLSEDDRLAFLSKASGIKNNNVYQLINDVVIQDSERKAMNEANSMEEVNFYRAVILGIMLHEEMVEELYDLYREKVNEKQRLSKEEKFSAI